MPKVTSRLSVSVSKYFLSAFLCPCGVNTLILLIYFDATFQDCKTKALFVFLLSHVQSIYSLPHLFGSQKCQWTETRNSQKKACYFTPAYISFLSPWSKVLYASFSCRNQWQKSCQRLLVIALIGGVASGWREWFHTVEPLTYQYAFYGGWKEYRLNHAESWGHESDKGHDGVTETSRRIWVCKTCHHRDTHITTSPWQCTQRSFLPLFLVGLITMPLLWGRFLPRRQHFLGSVWLPNKTWLKNIPLYMIQPFVL